MNQKGFSQIIFFVLLGILLVAIVAYFFSVNRLTKTQPINKNKENTSTLLQRAPSVTPIVSSQPNTQSVTISEDNDKIDINFDQCSPITRRINVAFGSTTIKIQGKDGDICELYYGGEVENPNWDGKLPNKCRVPTNSGTLTFAKSGYGVNLSAIQQYCTN